MPLDRGDTAQTLRKTVRGPHVPFPRRCAGALLPSLFHPCSLAHKPTAGPNPPAQLFYSFFKTLVGKTVIVELKNELCIRGKLHSVDQYLNLKLTDITVIDEVKYPHMVRARTAGRSARARKCQGQKVPGPESVLTAPL